MANKLAKRVDFENYENQNEILVFIEE